MSGYVINSTSAVVHTTLCQSGPMNPRRVSTAYEVLPFVVLDWLPTRLFCRHCCSHIIKAKQQGQGIPEPVTT